MNICDINNRKFATSTRRLVDVKLGRLIDIEMSNVDVFRMVPTTSVLRREIDVEVRRLSDDPCELCDIAGRPRDVYETSNFDVECQLFRDGPIDVGVLTGW